MTETHRILQATSLLTQLAMALILSTLLFAFYRGYRRTYLRWWGLAWLAHGVSLACTAFIVRFMAGQRIAGVWRLAVPFLNQFSGFLQILWLLQGTRDLAAAPNAIKAPSYRLLALAGGLAISTLLPGLLLGGNIWTEYVVRVGGRALLAGVAFVAAAALTFQVSAHAGGLARKVVPASFAAYALLNFYYAFLITTTALRWTSPGTIAYWGFVDLVLETLLGIALLSWMLEDERTRADDRAIAASRAESSLRAQENRFQRLVENASDAITVVDSQGVIRYSSPAITRVLGYEQAEQVGAQSDALLHPDDLDVGRSALAATVREPDVIHRVVCRQRHKNGSYRVLESALSRLPLDDGTADLVINSRDITERRELEQKLARTQRLEGLGRLAGGVAHDFNNLLTVVFGCVATAKIELGPGHAAAIDELDQLERTAARAATLTRQLLIFARQSEGEAKVLDLNQLVRDVLKLLRRLIGEDVELTDRISSERAPVRADPGQIEQVIINLAVNARDAMPAGGRLRIEVGAPQHLEQIVPESRETASGEYVELTVRDTGTGIPPEIRSHIFEPFFTTKEPGLGTGLGLATSYGIVRQHGGHIWCDDAEGGGTRFHVLLPLALGGEESAASVVPDTAARGRGETILLVEDDPAVRATSSRMLREHGYRVLEAENGEEALAIISGMPGPDLVLADLVMPRLGGLDLADRLKVQRPNLRVCFTSGYSHRRDLDRVSSQNLLRKPYGPRDLLLFVHRKLTSRAPD